MIWCGDYIDESYFYFPKSSALHIPSYDDIWSESVSDIAVSASDFTLDNKFLLNYDRKLFVDLNEYKTACTDENGWCIHPLPLLTAVGNGLGFGDFQIGNTGFRLVGSWAWQLISIEDVVNTDNMHKGFTKLNLVFKDGYKK